MRKLVVELLAFFAVYLIFFLADNYLYVEGKGTGRLSRGWSSLRWFVFSLTLFMLVVIRITVLSMSLKKRKKMLRFMLCTDK